ncbi:amiloride-sensitive sodium channel subunit gamma-like [Tachyglossus aculeatus]|uniref:amiloride-sensitive sodium channel subunit gamma-like n=1 Tax=Tachyglossus aculeatus TaxID=9261 RepID=UPI0018F57942|nr:amiloride-sensitive sodium channel subunit gamma-like [Tachyglossus aculeatus]
MAPGEKITAKIRKNLPIKGPQAPTIKELMKWYCLNTNTHGCRRIVVSRGRLRRSVWLLLTLTAVGLIVWQGALIILTSHDNTVSVQVYFQKLDFPAVTICNINPYKYSTQKALLVDLDTYTMDLLKKLYGFSKTRLKVLQGGNLDTIKKRLRKKFTDFLPLLIFQNNDPSKVATEILTGRRWKIKGDIVQASPTTASLQPHKDMVGFQLCANDDPTSCTIYAFNSGIDAIQEWYKLHFLTIMAQVPLEEKIRMSYSIEEFLVTCFFDGLPCDSRHFTLFHHPEYGNCYTFNSGKEEPVLSTSLGGSEYGLQAILYIDKEEYNPFLVSSYGVKAIVHHQDEYPYIENKWTAIETGKATSIGMHLVKLEKSQQPHNKCTVDGSDVPVMNLFNANYSKEICFHSCFQMQMVEKCHCALSSQPLPPAAKYCNFDQHPQWMKCYYKLHQKFVKEELECQKICKEECGSSEWELNINLAQWPSDVSEKWMLPVLTWDKGLGPNQTLNKRDFANLNIFYKNLFQRINLEKPSTSISDLISNLGGQMGLWLSCSIVCVVEIIEVLLVDVIWVLVRCCWSRQKVRQVWAPSEPPREDEANSPVPIFDDGLPTFNAALRLPLPVSSRPATPPPMYDSLQIEEPHPGLAGDPSGAEEEEDGQKRK